MSRQTGTDANNTLTLGTWDGTLQGGPGNDRLHAGSGDDILKGGTGRDTVIVDGQRGAFEIRASESGDITLDGPQGSDTLTGVETIEFADKTVQVMQDGDTPDDSMPAIQGRTFIESGGAVTASERIEVFGRSGGNEAVFIDGGVRGVELDANLERIDLPNTLGEYAFQVTDKGLQAFVDGLPVVTLPSANQDIEMRFANGSATLTQTGAATFEIAGDGSAATIDGDRETPGLSLSGETSTTTFSTTGNTDDADPLDLA